MQQEEVQAILLDKVKKARNEIENLTAWDECLVEMYDILEILDKLIEREEEHLDKRSDDYVKREDVIRYICESKECYKDACKGRQYKRCPDILWVYDLPSLKIN